MNVKPMKTDDTLLVSYSFVNGKDKGVLVVGRKHWNQSVDIVNAFEGKEAEDIYNMLVPKKEGKKDDI